LESTPVSAVQGAAALVVEVGVPVVDAVVVVVVKVHVQVTLTFVDPLTEALRFNTCVTTSVALGWLSATVTVFALLLPPPQPPSHTEANAAANATQLAIFRNLITPASHA
jgi:hypothetical protein